jgi:hypothetical protein
MVEVVIVADRMSVAGALVATVTGGRVAHDRRVRAAWWRWSSWLTA